MIWAKSWWSRMEHNEQPGPFLQAIISNPQKLWRFVSLCLRLLFPQGSCHRWFFGHSLVEPFMKAVANDLWHVKCGWATQTVLVRTNTLSLTFSPGWSNSSSLSQELPSSSLKPYSALPLELPNHRSCAFLWWRYMLDRLPRKPTSSITRTLLKADVR